MLRIWNGWRNTSNRGDKMDAQELRRDIERLKSSGRTTFENCERLVAMEKALRCLDAEGRARGEAHEGCLTMQEAEEWVGHMENVDGSTGAYWPMSQTEQIRAQHEISCGPVEFWVAINMMYSDYCGAAKKNSVNTVAFYASMAEAFLNDPDAKPDKLARYYRCIAER